MNTITLKIPEALNKQLNYFAKEKGLNKSEIVRLALSEFLSRDSSDSFMNCTEDLAGCVKGPADLSTNQAYFDGYGK